MFQIFKKTPQKRQLSALFSDMTPHEIAHLAIDVQHQFCNPYRSMGNAATHGAAAGISTLAPKFNMLGVSNYWVCYARDGHGVDDDGLIDQTVEWQYARKTLYEVKPQADDKFFIKNQPSAFAQSRFDEILRRDRRKTLVVSGVYFSRSVAATAINASGHSYGWGAAGRGVVGQAYNVVLMDDMSANGNGLCNADYKKALRKFKSAGVVLAHSDEVLEQLYRLA